MAKRRSPANRLVLSSEAAMLGMLRQRRSTWRVVAHRTAWLTVESTPKEEHVAFVRDISAKGIFFYSDFVPAVGDELDFVVEYLNGQAPARLHFKGAVVRVEEGKPGRTPGIAVSFPLQKS